MPVQPYYFGHTIQRPYHKDKTLIENMKIIRDINPDSSLGVWNYLRTGNSGWTLNVIEGVDENGESIVNQQLTDQLNERMKTVALEYGGGLDVLIDMSHLLLLTEGAVAAEVEVEESLNDFVDIHMVDPVRIDLRRDEDDQHLIYCYENAIGTLVDLSDLQFFYIPLDPDVDDPTGRSPILPIVQTVMFQIELLADLKQVVHSQGYPRIDVKVISEVILQNAPAEYKTLGQEANLKAWCEAQLEAIRTVYDTMKPDDAFIHFDTSEVEFKSPEGSLNFKYVADILNTQIISALKQLPVFLGRNEGTTETHGTVQYKIWVSGVESLQSRTKKLIEKSCDFILRLWGSQFKSEFEFGKITTTDRYKEAQSEKMENEARGIAQDRGWIDADEAAQLGYGHEAVGEQVDDPEEGTDEDDETGKDFWLSKNMRSIFDDQLYLYEIPHRWARELASTINNMSRATKETLDMLSMVYAQRIYNSPEPERAKKITDKKFKRWLKDNIFFDNEEVSLVIASTLQPWTREALEKAGQSVLYELNVDISYEVTRSVERWEEGRLHFTSKAIQERTEDWVSNSLYEGFKAGESIPKLSARIMDMTNVNRYRAEMIARTETLAASNYSTKEAYKQSGVVVGMLWEATGDQRTCPDCIDLEGEMISLVDSFGATENFNSVDVPPLHPQ
jgi:SPP1 gp7 family putative phage head morphogenesis protein